MHRTGVSCGHNITSLSAWMEFRSCQADLFIINSITFLPRYGQPRETWLAGATLLLNFPQLEESRRASTHSNNLWGRLHACPLPCFHPPLKGDAPTPDPRDWHDFLQLTMSSCVWVHGADTTIALIMFTPIQSLCLLSGAPLSYIFFSKVFHLKHDIIRQRYCSALISALGRQRQAELHRETLSWKNRKKKDYKMSLPFNPVLSS